MKCKNCGYEMSAETDFCLNCGINQKEIKSGMGWCSFLAYLYMPFCGLCAIIFGVIQIPGVAVNLLRFADKDLLEKFAFLNWNEFKTLFLIAGLIEIFFAGYYYYVAYCIINRRKNTLKHLCIHRVIIFVFYTVYVSAFIVLLKGNLITGSSELTLSIICFISQLVSMIIWLAINIRYFKNRKHIFTKEFKF